MFAFGLSERAHGADVYSTDIVLTAACPQMTAAASLARSFATLLTPHPGNARRLQKWITAARTASLPHLHAFTRGLDRGLRAFPAIAVYVRVSA